MRVNTDPGSWQFEATLQRRARTQDGHEDQHDDTRSDATMSRQDESTVDYAMILTSISSSSPRSVDLPPIQTQTASQSGSLPSLSELNLRPEVPAECIEGHPEPTSRRPSIASIASYSSTSDSSQHSALSPTYARSEASDDTYVGSFHSPYPQFTIPQYAEGRRLDNNHLVVPSSSSKPLLSMHHPTLLPAPTFHHQDMLHSPPRHQFHRARQIRSSPIMGLPPIMRSSKGISPCRITRRQTKQRGSPYSSGDDRHEPHNNRKYELANIDWIMYKRTNLENQWKDITDDYNANTPHLLQYAEINHTPEPRRSSSGLQAKYYRQRLEIPKRDEHGDLVIEDGRVVTVECKVRDVDDKENGRRADLITMFPERVAHYNYFFVQGPGEMEMARALAKRDIERKRKFGIPPWEPETRPQRRPRGSGPGAGA